MFLKQSVEMTRSHTQAVAQGFYAAIIQGTLADEPEGTRNRGRCTRPGWRTRRCLWTTSEARAKSRFRGGGSRFEECDISRLGHFHRTDRPAIDTGGSHPDEKPAIKSWVTGLPCTFKNFVLRVHGSNHRLVYDCLLARIGPHNFECTNRLLCL